MKRFLVCMLAGGILLLAFRTQACSCSKRANESSAIASLKTLVTAQEQYRATAFPAGGRASYGTLSELSGQSPPYVDSVLGRGKKSGYSFVVSVAPSGARWRAAARPVARGTSHLRRFFVDESGVIRFHRSREATSADSPIE